MLIPTVKGPIPGSVELLDRVQTALTPNRLPFLIAIDGMDGVGKSSLGSWLAWQLGMPAVHLDLFITSLHPIRWLTADLKRVVDLRLERGRPVIVEGVLVLTRSIRLGVTPTSSFSSRAAPG
jgi:2-phosphoglycerate kinase